MVTNATTSLARSPGVYQLVQRPNSAASGTFCLFHRYQSAIRGIAQRCGDRVADLVRREHSKVTIHGVDHDTAERRRSVRLEISDMTRPVTDDFFEMRSMRQMVPVGSGSSDHPRAEFICGRILAFLFIAHGKTCCPSECHERADGTSWYPPYPFCLTGRDRSLGMTLANSTVRVGRRHLTRPSPLPSRPSAQAGRDYRVFWERGLGIDKRAELYGGS